jgi:hypothetical protein
MMTGLSVLLLAVPAAGIIWLLLSRPPAAPRPTRRTTRIYQVSRVGGSRRRAAVDRAVAMAGGPAIPVTVETVGAVTPEVPVRTDEALPAAVTAAAESNAMARAEQTPAFQAAAATPAAASAAGTPLAEELPDPELADRLMD